MEKTEQRYQAYLQILKEELIPAMGCTEPIAVAYAAAVARQTLGELPDRVRVGASGSMIKNVKSVIVPNTDNMKGLEAAAAAGIVAGRPEQKLEVIADVTPEETKAIRAYLEQADVKVEHVENGVTFDIIVTVWKGAHTAQVRIAVFHTNLVRIEKDGEVLLDLPVHGDEEENLTDRSLLDMEHIWDFVHSVDIEDVKPILDPQIRYNMAIAEEGFRGDYGANIGSVLLDMEGNDVRVRASPISAAAGMRPSSTPSSMRWPSCRASSVMVPRPAVRPRSPRQWKPGCSAIICIFGASSSAAATASSPRAWRTRCGTWAAWANRA